MPRARRPVTIGANVLWARSVCVVVARTREAARKTKALAGAAAVALLVATAVGTALAYQGNVAPSEPAAAAVSSTQVGPGGAGSPTPTSRSPAAPAAPGGSSQVVSGSVASTSVVRFTASGQPVYHGSEPATMTLARDGTQLVITVAPR